MNGVLYLLHITHSPIKHLFKACNFHWIMSLHDRTLKIQYSDAVSCNDDLFYDTPSKTITTFTYTFDFHTPGIKASQGLDTKISNAEDTGIFKS